jgi:hypothetical protein
MDQVTRKAQKKALVPIFGTVSTLTRGSSCNFQFSFDLLFEDHSFVDDNLSATNLVNRNIDDLFEVFLSSWSHHLRIIACAESGVIEPSVTCDRRLFGDLKGRDYLLFLQSTSSYQTIGMYVAPF